MVQRTGIVKLRTVQGYVPALDGVRGLAIVLVMLCHLAATTPVHGLGRILMPVFATGWAGVDLFFVLSGFLITGILLDTKHAGNYLSSFYGRRVLRIFPIYYSALLLLNIGALLCSGHQWIQSRIPDWWPDRMVYFVYLQSWPIFWTRGSGGLVAHFWSLAVEEQFYLIWPLVIRLVPTRAILWFATLGLLMTIPLRSLMIPVWGLEAAFKFSPDRMDGLLVGALLAILVREGGIPVWLGRVAGLTGITILGFLAIGARQKFVPPSEETFTLGVTAFALISGYLVVSALRSGLLQTVFETRWLRSFGKYSYGLYIIHFPIFLVAQSVFGNLARTNLAYSLVFASVMIGSCFGLAKLSYDCFESRFLRLKNRFEPQFVRATEGGIEAASSDSYSPSRGSPIFVPAGNEAVG